MVLLSCVFCCTIVMGNASLRFITVSFSQAIGSVSVLFTAVLAFTFQGTRESHMTYLALLPIALGVVITSGGEPLFHAIGFALSISSTAGRAGKSVIQSITMTDPNEKLDPLSLLLYMSFICVVLLVPATLLLEPRAILHAHQLLMQQPSFAWWLLLNSSLAYVVNLTNFLVTKCTSALTLQVLGNAKGVVAAAVSVFVFGNHVTAQGCIGYLITVLGVVWYSDSKRRSGQLQEEPPAVTADGRMEAGSQVTDRLLFKQAKKGVTEEA